MNEFLDWGKYKDRTINDCLISLASAVYKAGGDPRNFTAIDLSRMTALKLIERIGPNNIIFKFNKEKN